MADRNPVGLIGIGLLGQALASRLLGAGFAVVGIDRDPTKNETLVQLGGQSARSVADLGLAEGAPVVAAFKASAAHLIGPAAAFRP